MFLCTSLGFSCFLCLSCFWVSRVSCVSGFLVFLCFSCFLCFWISRVSWVSHVSCVSRVLGFLVFLVSVGFLGLYYDSYFPLRNFKFILTNQERALKAYPGTVADLCSRITTPLSREQRALPRSTCEMPKDIFTKLQRATSAEVYILERRYIHVYVVEWNSSWCAGCWHVLRRERSQPSTIVSMPELRSS